MTTIPEALAIALRHHQSGDLGRAEQIYREILRVQAEHPVALHFLGVLLYQRGQHEAAIVHLRRALARAPDAAAAHNNLGNALQASGKLEEGVASYRRALELDAGSLLAHNNLGNALLKLGRLDEAVDSYRRALELRPDHAEAHANLGAALRAQGELEQAVASCRRALEIRPDYPEAYATLGNALRAQGKLEEAVASFRRALTIRPDYAEAHNNLGAALGDQGRLDDAVACFREAVRLRPDYAEAHHNLGKAFRELDRLDEAVASYRRAVELRPDYPEAYSNLGNALRVQGRLEEAVACHRRAVELKPESADAHNNLGNALREQRRLEEAVTTYRRALEIRPGSAGFHSNLGNALRDLGELEEARRSYAQAVALEPAQALHRLAMVTLCPAVFPSVEAIEEYRRGFMAEIRELAEADLSIGVAELGLSGSVPPFNLPFQGGDDRPIKEAYARLFQRRLPEGRPAARDGRPRLGFVVTRNHEALFLRYMSGVIQHLSRGPFELVIVCSQAGQGRVVSGLPIESMQLLLLPERLDRAVEAVRAAGFDLLYYWEVGTDPINYFLPFFRLAPIQCTSWGFPVTSGIPQLDYFLSSALIEGEDADRHYSERLLRATTLLTYQSRVPTPDQPASREEFGFAPDQHLYLCAQRLGKFHPDFDRVLAGILRRDDRGVVVAVEDQHGFAAALLRRRFTATIPDVAERVVFLPRQSYPEYLNLLAAADVLLDPLHYGGGVTTYDGFSLGKPIVTLPSRFARGRATLGCYRKMGITECVATDPDGYADTAVRLGTDAEYRASVEARIREASDGLFQDVEAVREHERLFRRLGEEARAGTATRGRQAPGRPAVGAPAAATSDSEVARTIAVECYGAEPEIEPISRYRPVFRLRFPTASKVLKLGRNASDPAIAKEVMLIGLVARHGIPVPTVEHADGEGRLAGRTFFIMESVGDRTVAHWKWKPGEVPRRLFTEMGSLLARIHSIVLPESADIQHDRVVPRDPESYRRRVDRLVRWAVAEGVLDAREAARFGAFALPKADAAELCHGYFHAAQCIVHDERIAAVVDWGRAWAGNRAIDLAIVQHYLDYYCPTELGRCFFAGYQAVRPLPERFDEACLPIRMAHALARVKVWHARGRAEKRRHEIELLRTYLRRQPGG